MTANACNQLYQTASKPINVTVIRNPYENQCCFVPPDISTSSDIHANFPSRSALNSTIQHNHISSQMKLKNNETHKKGAPPIGADSKTLVPNSQCSNHKRRLTKEDEPTEEEITHVPNLIRVLAKHLFEHGKYTEGIFRISGSSKVIDKMRLDLIGESAEKATVNLSADSDHLSAAQLLKMTLRDLDKPIIPPDLLAKLTTAMMGHSKYNKDQHCDCNSFNDCAGLVNSHFRRLLADKRLTARGDYVRLCFVCRFLSNFSQAQDTTQMGAKALSVVFGPNLVSLSEPAIASLFKGDMFRTQMQTNEIVCHMITNFDAVFTSGGEGSLDDIHSDLIMFSDPPFANQRPTLAEIKSVRRLRDQSSVCSSGSSTDDSCSSFDCSLSQDDGSDVSTESFPEDPVQLVKNIGPGYSKSNISMNNKTTKDEAIELQRQIERSLPPSAVSKSRGSLLSWKKSRMSVSSDETYSRSPDFDSQDEARGDAATKTSGSNKRFEAYGKRRRANTTPIFVRTDYDQDERKPLNLPLDLCIQNNNCDGNDMIAVQDTARTSWPLSTIGGDVALLSPRSGVGNRIGSVDDDSNLAPSPPTAHEDARAIMLAENIGITEEEMAAAELTKRIHYLKRKIRKFDNEFEAQFGYKPSHMEKMSRSNIKRYMTELGQTKRQLKHIRESNFERAEYGYVGYGVRRPSGGSEPAGRNDWNSGRTPSGITEIMEKTLAALMRRLDDKRSTSHRPCAVESMNEEQVLDEKLAVQMALLQFESIHGRPTNKSEKDLVRPLYDRYKAIKKLVNGNTPPASPKLPVCAELLQDQEDEFAEEDLGGTIGGTPGDILPLQPILEHEAMSFDSVSNGDRQPSPIVGSAPQSAADMRNISAVTIKDNLHELARMDLILEQRRMRDDKRKLRRLLSELETKTTQNRGRLTPPSLLASTESSMKAVKLDDLRTDGQETVASVVYGKYKQVRAQLKLIQALLNKP